MLSKKNLAVSISLALVVLAPLNFAGAVIGSTEPTQLMNNLELMDVNLNTLDTVAQEVKQNATLANQYVTQLQQYVTQMKQLQNYLPDELQSTYRNAVELKKGYDDMSGAVTKLYGDVSNSKTAAENIFRDMSLKGLTTDQYLDRIRNNTDRTRDHVASMLGELDRSMKTVERSYDQVKQFQDKIPATEGVHESMQLMNSQMNALLVQQGQFMQTSMAALRNQVEDNAKKVKEEENSNEIMKQYYDEKSRFAKEFKQKYFGDTSQ